MPFEAQRHPSLNRSVDPTGHIRDISTSMYTDVLGRGTPELAVSSVCDLNDPLHVTERDTVGRLTRCGLLALRTAYNARYVTHRIIIWCYEVVRECIVVVVLCVLLSSYVYLLYYVCIAVSTIDAGLLAISQCSEGPATGHLDTGFSWISCVYKQMLRWFPRFQVAATCFSCSPPDLNLLVTNFKFCIHVR